MHESVKLSGAIWLLQLVISSPLIHALVWPESSLHWDSNPGPQHERWTTYQLSYPCPFFVFLVESKLQLKLQIKHFFSTLRTTHLKKNRILNFYLWSTIISTILLSTKYYVSIRWRNLLTKPFYRNNMCIYCVVRYWPMPSLSGLSIFMVVVPSSLLLRNPNWNKTAIYT